ncbi:MAG: DUF547 domain-containing protein [Myxococcota bacterium]
MTPLFALRDGRRRVAHAALVAAVGLALVLAGAPLLGVHELPQRVAPGRYDLADLASALRHARPEAAGARYDYAALRRDPAPLERFVAALANVGPRTTPERFPDRASRLAYALNAYNALILAAVLAHGVRESVHEVRGPLEPTPGFGFFWALKLRVDGARTNLFVYEHDVIRAFGDARIHAALNCASVSCPALRSEPFRPETLDAQLDAAMKDMVAGERHVAVDAEGVALSAIFDWFEEDFAANARRSGLAPPKPHELVRTGWVLAFLQAYADPAKAEAIGRATSVRYRAYDWSLNDTALDHTARDGPPRR